MKEIPLNFSRELTFTYQGETKTGNLTVTRLYFDSEAGSWRCEWSLDHLYPEAVHFTGDDPLAALTRTLEFAGEFIRGRIEDGYEIYWQDEEDMGGFWKSVE